MSTIFNISDKIQLTNNPNPFFLLDNYSGASAAYSVRKMSSSYSGYAMRVTTNGSDSADISFVDNELDTQSIETFANGSSVYVSTWYDQSGNENNLSRPVLSDMPLIAVNGSVALINNKPVLKGDGNTKLNFTNTISLSGDFNIVNVSPFVQGTMPFGGPSGDFYYHLADRIRYRMSGVTFDFHGYNNFSEEQILSNINRNSGYISYRHKGELNTYTTTNTATFTLTNAFTGNGSFYGPAMNQEIVIWEKEQSSVLSDIETNINDFYSIY